jgi:predicted DNA-binding transcriptional regulator YafY
MRAEAEKVAQRFHADPVAWFQGAEDNALLPDLAQAVWAARQIRMQYDSWEKVVERVASPLGLVLKGGLWYLVAAVEAQPRTYRVGNILALTVLDTAAKAPAKFNLKTYWQDFARDYEARMHKDQCRVRANAAGRKRLSQFGDAYRRAILAAGDANADWLDVTLPMETVADSAAQLLGLAPDAVALGPTALVEAIQRKLQSAREAYGISRKVR